MKEHEAEFEEHRSALLALAYRMLGDLARAEDAVQEAWLRWQKRHDAALEPRAFLLTTVTNLCLDELNSARARREESRGDRLPEPIDLDASGLGRVEMADRISMAFLVMLQRLTPAERAVFVLHEIFDVSHDRIAGMLHRTPAACRQMLNRARANVRSERRALQASHEEHERLLGAFVKAIGAGDHGELYELLAEDAVFVGDPGSREDRTFGRIRNVGQPVVGRERILALVRAIASQDVQRERNTVEGRTLNGLPAVVISRDGQPATVISLETFEGKIQKVFMHFDPARLRHIGRAN